VVVPGVDVLITAVFQVPGIGGILVELLGKISGVAFLQYGPNCVKVGVISGSITIDIVVGSAHSLALGVNVNINVPAVDVLMTEGTQVPVIGGASLEDDGSVGAELF